MGRIKIGRIYSMKVIEVEAVKDNLEKIIDFIKDELSDFDCPSKTIMKIRLAVEEIFVNIASYAYSEKSGNVTIGVDIVNNPKAVVITFTDNGKKFNPLLKEDPRLDIPIEDRKEGGLGIYLVKNSMDEYAYNYKKNQNNLILKKFL